MAHLKVVSGRWCDTSGVLVTMCQCGLLLYDGHFMCIASVVAMKEISV